jgi:lipid-binding SYLF domain-containing protein
MHLKSIPTKLLPVTALAITILTGIWTRQAIAADASEIDEDSTAALETLYKDNAEAQKLGKNAKGILIFPRIKKAGFIIGGEGGDGALRKGDKTVAYYRSAAASYGLQAGVQSFGYILFFMDDASLKYLESSEGWEIGTGPSVVIADEGFAKTASTTTLKKGIYAFIFGQKGLMAGIGLKGSKITKIEPKP